MSIINSIHSAVTSCNSLVWQTTHSSKHKMDNSCVFTTIWLKLQDRNFIDKQQMQNWVWRTVWQHAVWQKKRDTKYFRSLILRIIFCNPLLKSWRHPWMGSVDRLTTWNRLVNHSLGLADKNGPKSMSDMNRLIHDNSVNGKVLYVSRHKWAVNNR